jgi:hypothetical protein
MTEGHKHRTVRVRKGGLIHRLLCKPLYWTDDRAKVDASPYPYGVYQYVSTDREVYWLSALSILHRWTGLTLEVKKEDGQ